MKGTIVLNNPIQITGRTVREIEYDANEITSLLYAEADARKKIALGKNIGLSPAVEFDFGFHMYVGFAAAIAVNPAISFDDLERVKGADVTKFTSVGRSFLLQSELSQESSSGEQSENTAELSTQAPQTSNESE